MSVGATAMAAWFMKLPERAAVNCSVPVCVESSVAAVHPASKTARATSASYWATLNSPSRPSWVRPAK